MRSAKSHSPSRRVSALSPLQAFSPLEPEAHHERRSPAGSTGTGTATPTSISRSNSMRLERSLSSRERVFTPDHRRRASNASMQDSPQGIVTRLLLVKAPAEKAEGTLRQRSKSSSSLVNAPYTSVDAPATSNAPRRSFAAASFSSFTPMTSSPHKRHESIGSDARVSQSTPFDGGADLRRALSPEEVVDLARGLMSPTIAQETRPGHRRRSSSGSARMVEPEPVALEPVDYVELDQDSLLPYTNRPQEVAELLTNQRNQDLVALLEAGFPDGPVRSNWKDIDVREWNWNEFLRHLTTVDRRECADYEWVQLARDAVRQHSVALWEKLGTCLGCDTDLIMAGEEDEAPASWGGLALGEEGEYDASLSRVFIEGLPASDPAEDERGERELTAAFDRDDDDWGAVGGFSSNMATIGEHEQVNAQSGKPTTAQLAASGTTVDTFPSPGSPHAQLPTAASSSPDDSAILSSPGSSPGRTRRSPQRSKSFVGLQIVTGPAPASPGAGLSRSSSNASLRSPQIQQFDRGPGNPLFPSSFNTLSLGPNLGRKASVAYGYGTAPVAHPDQFRADNSQRWRMPRKASGAGLSESAITFVSDSSSDAWGGRQ